MQNNSIFYVVHGQFFKNSSENKKKPKKIVRIHKIFKDEKPKKLRKKALQFFEKIRDEKLIKTNADCPSYKIHSKADIFTSKSDYSDSIQDVPFVLAPFSSEVKIALTLSFGQLASTYRYAEYPYNKMLYPIAVVGKSLHDVEDCIKVNLVLEKRAYEKHNFQMPKHCEVTNFLHKNAIVNYIMDDKCNNLDTKILQQEYKKTKHSFFKTPQFYKIDKRTPKNFDGLTFLESIEKANQLATEKLISIYKKELRNLSRHFSIRDNRTIDLTKLQPYKIKTMINPYRLRAFLSKKQIEILNEIEENPYCVRKLLQELL